MCHELRRCVDADAGLALRAAPRSQAARGDAAALLAAAARVVADARQGPRRVRPRALGAGQTQTGPLGRGPAWAGSEDSGASLRPGGTGHGRGLGHLLGQASQPGREGRQGHHQRQHPHADLAVAVALPAGPSLGHPQAQWPMGLPP